MLISESTFNSNNLQMGAHFLTCTYVDAKYQIWKLFHASLQNYKEFYPLHLADGCYLFL